MSDANQYISSIVFKYGDTDRVIWSTQELKAFKGLEFTPEGCS